MSKNSKQAKASLKTEVGTIEIEGAEDFVKTGIADLVKQLRADVVITEPLGQAETAETKKEKETSKKRKRSSSSRNSLQPKLISDLVSKDKIDGFRKFFEEKSPNNHQEAFVVVAHWLKYNLDLENLSIDEMWTAHKILKRKGPKNWIQVFRDTKSKKGWLDSVPDQEGKYTITPMGESLVEHDLPLKAK